MLKTPLRERPREKARRLGIATLSNQELMAILLRTGTRENSVLELAGLLLSEADGIEGLVDLSMTELKKIKGIGEVKAVELMAVIELSKRLMSGYKGARLVLDSPQVIYRYLGGKLQLESQEKVVLLCLSATLQLVSEKLIHIGSSDSSIFSIKDILREVLKSGSSRFIVIHNHPSGNPRPSPYDIEATKILQRQAEELGLELVDHLIFGENCYYSILTDRLINSN